MASIETLDFIMIFIRELKAGCAEVDKCDWCRFYTENGCAFITAPENWELEEVEENGL